MLRCNFCIRRRKGAEEKVSRRKGVKEEKRRKGVKKEEKVSGAKLAVWVAMLAGDG